MTLIDLARPTQATTQSGRVARSSSPWVRSFRPDIEGMRAIAVVIVVLYHAGVPFLTGGFVGVDVFFVISGFLITRHLHGELLSHGTISLRNFYARRIRRLLPLATLVTLTTLGATWALASTLEARKVATDATWVTLFAMNIHLANTGVDYQANQDPSPLQHYWSLAIEEQFYLLWPLILAAASLLWLRSRRRTNRVSTTTLILVTTTATLASFAYGLHQTDVARSLAYFVTPARAWELGIGGLIAITAPTLARLHRHTRDLLTLTGLAAILYSAITYTDATAFPGTAALIPVLGAAAMITAGLTHPTLLETHALAHPIPQGLGKISYGLYLWHWPILILTPAYLDAEPSPVQTAAAVIFAVWVATMTYFAVEDRVRVLAFFQRRPRRSLIAGALTMAFALTATMSAAAFIPDPHGEGAAAATVDPAKIADAIVGATTTKELPRNLTPALADVSKDTPNPKGDGISCMVDLLDTGVARTPGGTCVFGDPKGKTTVVLTGDSHAYQWLPSLEAIAAQRHWKVISMTKSGCALYDVKLTNTLLKRDYTECYAWRKNVLERIRTEKPAEVLTSAFVGSERTDAGFTTEWAAGVTTTVKTIRGMGIPVTVISDTPYPAQDVPTCLAAHLVDIRACNATRTAALSDPARRGLTAKSALAAGAGVIDPTPWFCTDKTCPAVVGTTVLYSDNSHMSATWSKATRRLLANELDRVLPTLAGNAPTT